MNSKKAAIELSTKTIIIVALGVVLFIFLIMFLLSYFPQTTNFVTQLRTSLIPDLTEIMEGT